MPIAYILLATSLSLPPSRSKSAPTTEVEALSLDEAAQRRQRVAQSVGRGLNAPWRNESARGEKFVCKELLWFPLPVVKQLISQ